MNARETIVGFLLALIVFMSVFLIFLHFKPFYYYNFQTLNVYDWKKDKKILFKTGLFLILIISLFAVLSLADFNIVFTKFHEIFFPQGNYMFDPEVSFMKYMFPDEFFVNFLKTMFCSLLIIAIGFEIAYFYLKNRAEKLIN